jgi:hypothetical protein
MVVLRRLNGCPGHPPAPAIDRHIHRRLHRRAALLALGALGVEEPAMAHGALLAISARLILAPPTVLTGLLDRRDLPDMHDGRAEKASSAMSADPADLLVCDSRSCR